MTGMPCSRAQVLTGGSLTLSPRPAGRSGWVTTMSGTMLTSASSSNTYTANRGVPKKMMEVSGFFIRCFVLLRRGFGGHVSVFRLMFVEVGRLVDEENAVQVVALVLEYLREEVGAVVLELLASGVLGAHSCLEGPLHHAVHLRDRQAALLHRHLFPRVSHELRVYERHVRVLEVTFVSRDDEPGDDEDAVGDADLRRRDRDAVMGGPQGRRHARDHIRELCGTELALWHVLGLLPQDRRA